MATDLGLVRKDKATKEEALKLRDEQRREQLQKEQEEREAKTAAEWAEDKALAEQLNALHIVWQPTRCDIPDQMYTLTGLTSIRLIGMGIRRLPNVFDTRHRSVTQLILTANKLERLPPSLAALTSLTQLGLSKNRLRKLPGWFGTAFARVTDLDLSSNKLERLPDSIGEMSHLPRLLCDNNRLRSLPQGLSTLHQLKLINLNGNNVKQLPLWLDSLTGLTSLSVNNNRVVEWPFELCLLPKLTILSLCSNRLTAIPSQVQLMTKLQQLALDYNQFTVFPLEMQHLKSLRLIRVEGNPLRKPPLDVVQTQGAQGLRDWCATHVGKNIERQQRTFVEKVQKVLQKMADEGWAHASILNPEFELEVNEVRDEYFAFVWDDLFEEAWPKAKLWYVKEGRKARERQRRLEGRGRAASSATGSALSDSRRMSRRSTGAGGSYSTSRAPTRPTTRGGAEDAHRLVPPLALSTRAPEGVQPPGSSESEASDATDSHADGSHDDDSRVEGHDGSPDDGDDDSDLDSDELSEASVSDDEEEQFWGTEKDEVWDILATFEDPYGKLAFAKKQVMFRRCRCVDKNGDRRPCVPPKRGFLCQRRAHVLKKSVVSENQFKRREQMRREQRTMKQALEQAEKSARAYLRTLAGRKWVTKEALEAANADTDNDRQKYHIEAVKRKWERRRMQYTAAAEVNRRDWERRRKITLDALRAKEDMLVAKLEAAKVAVVVAITKSELKTLRAEMDNLPEDIELEKIDDGLEVMMAKFKDREAKEIAAWKPTSGFMKALENTFSRSHPANVQRHITRLQDEYVAEKVEVVRAKVAHEQKLMRRIMKNWAGMGARVAFEAWRDWFRKRAKLRRRRHAQQEIEARLVAETAEADLRLKEAELAKWTPEIDPFSDETFWRHSETNAVRWDEPTLDTVTFMPADSALPGASAEDSTAFGGGSELAAAVGGAGGPGPPNGGPPGGRIPGMRPLALEGGPPGLPAASSAAMLGDEASSKPFLPALESR